MQMQPNFPPNIVLKAASDSPDGTLPKSPPEGVPPGIFLHYIRDDWRPLLAEGVVWDNPANRNIPAQGAVSGPFNAVEKRMMDASHLIPRTLGGSGEAYNLVALPSHFNKGPIRAFETRLEAKAKKAPHYLQVFVTYEPGRDLPTSVTYFVYKMAGVTVITPACDTATFWISH